VGGGGEPWAELRHAIPRRGRGAGADAQRHTLAGAHAVEHGECRRLELEHLYADAVSNALAILYADGERDADREPHGFAHAA
jgi:hypothetical protein